jgi:hypothetical protein
MSWSKISTATEMSTVGVVHTAVLGLLVYPGRAIPSSLTFTS